MLGGSKLKARLDINIIIILLLHFAHLILYTSGEERVKRGGGRGERAERRGARREEKPEERKGEERRGERDKRERKKMERKQKGKLNNGGKRMSPLIYASACVVAFLGASADPRLMLGTKNVHQCGQYACPMLLACL